jgi:hypothetical protein
MEDLIPLFAIVFVFGAPMAYWLISRILAHQERMEMLRQGFMPPPDPRAMRRAAKYGWTPGAPPVPPPPAGFQNYGNAANYSYDANFDAQRQLRKGIQVAFVGLALLIGLSFIGGYADGHPVYGPWLLGGLIPMFVGIAQIITAILGGARFGPGIGVNQVNASYDPGVTAGAPSGSRPADVPSGPTGWRPGPTPEIQKPAQPPDYR